jgi:hypothetical protein
MKRFLAPVFICLFLILSLFSCKKDKILGDSSAKLHFSKDTVFFDTVFTTQGSTTRHFLVRNTYKQPITISHIRLAGGASSPFKVNVDGVPTIALNDVQIPAKDSLYIWVKVNVNPSPSGPMIVSDSLLFDLNGNRQHVIFEAIGQDVYLHKPNQYFLLSDGSSVPYSFATCNDVWTNDKPHLIYKYLVVDSACTLTMQPGTRVYLHSNSVLWVYKNGTLKVQGSLNQPVHFQGDRLEPEYAGVPGQWGNIWLSPLSRNNTIDWAILKNGSIGIQADTVDKTTGNPTLRLSNTIIENMSVAGIYAQGASIVAANVAIANCAKYSVALTIGGSYSFRQCSFGDYYNLSNRTTPQVVVSNWYKDLSGSIQERNLDSAHFFNCIVYGTLDEELKLDSSISSASLHFRYFFDHCLLKTGNTNAVVSHFSSNIFNADPAFADVGNNNLNIHAGSAAIGQGASTGISQDLNGKPMNSPPDIGAYQH